MPESTEKGYNFNYILGIINLAVVFCIVWLCWYIFMHADGVMKLYTPMYGFALVALLVSAIILLTKVLGWPASPDKPLSSGAALASGIGGAILALVLMWVINYVIFWNFLGALGVAYFSPSALVAGGGTGAEPWNAREWASTAILYYATAFLWWALVWDLGFGKWPWQDNRPAVRACSKVFAVSFFSIITYAILFHPHVCLLFPQAQKMVGAAAWWEGWAQTSSAFYGLGVVMCTIFWVVFGDVLWEGYPYRLMEREGQGTLLKGIVTVVVTFVLGLILVWVLGAIFNAIWMEAFVGGQYTDGPDWRFIHMAELCGFWVLFAFVWKYYFNNFPNGMGLFARAVIRSIICTAGGLLIYWFYYSPLTKFFLGKVEGWGQPDDKPLVWTMLFLAVVLIQGEFFHNWPLRRKTD